MDPLRPLAVFTTATAIHKRKAILHRSGNNNSSTSHPLLLGCRRKHYRLAVIPRPCLVPQYRLVLLPLLLSHLRVCRLALRRMQLILLEVDLEVLPSLVAIIAIQVTLCLVSRRPNNSLSDSDNPLQPLPFLEEHLGRQRHQQQGRLDPVLLKVQQEALEAWDPLEHLLRRRRRRNNLAVLQLVMLSPIPSVLPSRLLHRLYRLVCPPIWRRLLHR